MTVAAKEYSDAWDASYRRRENYLFYPHEEIIRFFSKYIAKRIGIDEFERKGDQRRGLDFGCGIGRHMVFGEGCGIEMHGIDLSKPAIEFGKTWLSSLGLDGAATRMLQGSGLSLPWKDNHFDFAVSHGVLDSMTYSVAKRCLVEVHRTLAKGGLFYCDLISNQDSSLDSGFCGEMEVQSLHEQGTIQNYFDQAKVDALFSPLFETVSRHEIRRRDCVSDHHQARWHCVVRKVESSESV